MNRSINIAETTQEQVLSMPKGRIFRYSDIDIPASGFEALAASLSRMTKRGLIKRLKKGYYYIPRQTAFGELKPGQNEIIRKFTNDQNNLTGYESGLSLFNSLKLTTQIPNQVTIVTAKPKSYTKIANLKFKFIKTNINFSRADIKLLQLLDALKKIKTIPDSNINNSVEIIKSHFSKLSDKELTRMLTLAGYYNPSARALAGAIISGIVKTRVNVIDNDKENRKKDPESFIRQKLHSRLCLLKDSLNPLTIYKIPVDESVLPDKNDWSIK
jgi:hypothetical protein